MFLMKKGASGQQVKNIQIALHMLRYYRSSIDGHFGEGTKAAVIDFQETFDMNMTGVVDTATYTALKSEVAPIQRALKNKGYLDDYTAGVTRDADWEALLEFQSDYGLTVDGFVGPATRQQLFRTDNFTNATTLQYGDRGGLVPNLQYALTILCCHPGDIDGHFGPQTEAAVKTYQSKHGFTQSGIVSQAVWSSICGQIDTIRSALKNAGADYSSGADPELADSGLYEEVKIFQRDHGLVVDGLCGPATRSALGLSYATENDNFPLSRGKNGPNVLNLQYALWIMQIDPNGFDSSFGGGCERGVKTFQARKSMTQTGIVDTETWTAICSEILPIVKALENHNHHIEGYPSGVSMMLVYNAVKAFQTEKGLTSDGLVGSATKAALGITDGTYAGTTTAYVVRGSKGSIVRYLQNVLSFLGYNITVDGSFGPAMEAVVMEFQEDNDLDVDGHFGPASWAKLFTLYNPASTGTTAAEKLVSIAQHELSMGFVEENSNNISPYGQWYEAGNSSWNGQAWCAMFVSFCARKAGIAETNVPIFAYCPSGVEWFRSRKKYYKKESGYIPNPGDIVFFYSDELGRVAHTGIVIERTGTDIKTIEGNATDAVREKNYSMSSVRIDGYGHNSLPIPVHERTQEEVDAELDDIYRSILALYGIDGSTIVHDESYSNAIAGEDAIYFSTGIANNEENLPTSMYTCSISDNAIDTLMIRAGKYQKIVQSYGYKDEVGEIISSIEQIIEGGSIRYAVYDRNGAIETEIYYCVEFTARNGSTKIYYVKVTHSILKQKYVQMLGISTSENSENWMAGISLYNNDATASLTFIINRVFLKKKRQAGEMTFAEIVEADYGFVYFTRAEQLRNERFHNIIEAIDETLEEIAEEYVSTHAVEIEYGVPLPIADLGFAEVSIEHGVTETIGEGRLYHTFSLAPSDDFDLCFAEIEESFSAVIGEDVRLTTTLENLEDLAMSLEAGHLSTEIKLTPTGGVEFKMRFDFPDQEIVPNATGGYYVEIVVKTKNGDLSAYGLSTNPVQAFNEAMEVLQVSFEEWGRIYGAGFALVGIAIFIICLPELAALLGTVVSYVYENLQLLLQTILANQN